MLSLQAQHDKFNRLHSQYNLCNCLLMRTDWRRASLVDADFEAPFEPLPPGFLRLVYFISDCYYCDQPTLFGITYHSRGISGINLLVQAIDYCNHTITEQMRLDGSVDDVILHRIRNEIRAAWIKHNPNPI